MKSNEQIAIRVSIITIIGNVLLSIFKLIAGIIGHSAAMLSDAVHSLSDVLSTIIVIIGIKIACKASDTEHPYGHERFECVAAIILAMLLAATGLVIGYGGLKNIIAAQYDHLVIPGVIALAAALVSIIVKEAMYWYTRAAALNIRSSALMADAWHHRSDALSSVGSFAGIFGARMGYPILDSVACLIICVFIAKAAYDIFMDAIGKMVDKACDDEITQAIHDQICAQTGILGVDLLQTRLFGNRIYVDVEISVDRNLSLCDSHDIAHRVHDTIETAFPEVKHCMVHVNPAKEVVPDRQSIYQILPRYKNQKRRFSRHRH